MLRSLLAAALSVCLAGSAWAQTPPTRIRGTIAGLSGQTLTVNSRDGQKLDIVLADNLTVASVKKLELSSIAPGSYIGVATRSGPDGKPLAIEVLVFPEAMRGAGEGHYAWDLEPGSMMTNGNIDGVSAAPVGRDLTVSYKGGNIVVHVPADAPVVTFAPADKADLKPGAPVFLGATKAADGHLTAARVTVGKDGVAPPM
jgi:hypothetical protein